MPIIDPGGFRGRFIQRLAYFSGQGQNATGEAIHRDNKDGSKRHMCGPRGHISF